MFSSAGTSTMRGRDGNSERMKRDSGGGGGLGMMEGITRNTSIAASGVLSAKEIEEELAAAEGEDDWMEESLQEADENDEDEDDEEEGDEISTAGQVGGPETLSSFSPNMILSTTRKKQKTGGGSGGTSDLPPLPPLPPPPLPYNPYRHHYAVTSSSSVLHSLSHHPSLSHPSSSFASSSSFREGGGNSSSLSSLTSSSSSSLVESGGSTGLPPPLPPPLSPPHSSHSSFLLTEEILQQLEVEEEEEDEEDEEEQEVPLSSTSSSSSVGIIGKRSRRHSSEDFPPPRHNVAGNAVSQYGCGGNIMVPRSDGKSGSGRSTRSSSSSGRSNGGGGGNSGGTGDKSSATYNHSSANGCNTTQSNDIPISPIISSSTISSFDRRHPPPPIAEKRKGVGGTQHVRHDGNDRQCNICNLPSSFPSPFSVDERFSSSTSSLSSSSLSVSLSSSSSLASSTSSANSSSPSKLETQLYHFLFPFDSSDSNISYSRDNSSKGSRNRENTIQSSSFPSSSSPPRSDASLFVGGFGGGASSESQSFSSSSNMTSGSSSSSVCRSICSSSYLTKVKEEGFQLEFKRLLESANISSSPERLCPFKYILLPHPLHRDFNAHHIRQLAAQILKDGYDELLADCAGDPPVAIHYTKPQLLCKHAAGGQSVLKYTLVSELQGRRVYYIIAGASRTEALLYALWMDLDNSHVRELLSRREVEGLSFSLSPSSPSSSLPILEKENGGGVEARRTKGVIMGGLPYFTLTGDGMSVDECMMLSWAFNNYRWAWEGGKREEETNNRRLGRRRRWGREEVDDEANEMTLGEEGQEEERRRGRRTMKKNDGEWKKEEGEEEKEEKDEMTKIAEDDSESVKSVGSQSRVEAGRKRKKGIAEESEEGGKMMRGVKIIRVEGGHIGNEMRERGGNGEEEGGGGGSTTTTGKCVRKSGTEEEMERGREGGISEEKDEEKRGEGEQKENEMKLDRSYMMTTMKEEFEEKILPLTSKKLIEEIDISPLTKLPSSSVQQSTSLYVSTNSSSSSSSSWVDCRFKREGDEEGNEKEEDELNYHKEEKQKELGHSSLDVSGICDTIESSSSSSSSSSFFSVMSSSSQSSSFSFDVCGNNNVTTNSKNSNNDENDNNNRKSNHRNNPSPSSFAFSPIPVSIPLPPSSSDSSSSSFSHSSVHCDVSAEKRQQRYLPSVAVDSSADSAAIISESSGGGGCDDHLCSSSTSPSLGDSEDNKRNERRRWKEKLTRWPSFFDLQDQLLQLIRRISFETKKNVETWQIVMALALVPEYTYLAVALDVWIDDIPFSTSNIIIPPPRIHSSSDPSSVSSSSSPLSSSSSNISCLPSSLSCPTNSSVSSLVFNASQSTEDDNVSAVSSSVSSSPSSLSSSSFSSYSSFSSSASSSSDSPPSSSSSSCSSPSSSSSPFYSSSFSLSSFSSSLSSSSTPFYSSSSSSDSSDILSFVLPFVPPGKMVVRQEVRVSRTLNSLICLTEVLSPNFRNVDVALRGASPHEIIPGFLHASASLEIREIFRDLVDYNSASDFCPSVVLSSVSSLIAICTSALRRAGVLQPSSEEDGEVKNRKKYRGEMKKDGGDLQEEREIADDEDRNSFFYPLTDSPRPDDHLGSEEVTTNGQLGGHPQSSSSPSSSVLVASSSSFSPPYVGGGGGGGSFSSATTNEEKTSASMNGSPWRIDFDNPETAMRQIASHPSLLGIFNFRGATAVVFLFTQFIYKNVKEYSQNSFVESFASSVDFFLSSLGELSLKCRACHFNLVNCNDNIRLRILESASCLFRFAMSGGGENSPSLCLRRLQPYASEISPAILQAALWSSPSALSLDSKEMDEGVVELTSWKEVKAYIYGFVLRGLVVPPVEFEAITPDPPLPMLSAAAQWLEKRKPEVLAVVTKLLNAARLPTNSAIRPRVQKGTVGEVSGGYEVKVLDPSILPMAQDAKRHFLSSLLPLAHRLLAHSTPQFKTKHHLSSRPPPAPISSSFPCPHPPRFPPSSFSSRAPFVGQTLSGSNVSNASSDVLFVEGNSKDTMETHSSYGLSSGEMFGNGRRGGSPSDEIGDISREGGVRDRGVILLPAFAAVMAALKVSICFVPPQFDSLSPTIVDWMDVRSTLAKWVYGQSLMQLTKALESSKESRGAKVVFCMADSLDLEFKPVDMSIVYDRLKSDIRQLLKTIEDFCKTNPRTTVDGYWTKEGGAKFIQPKVFHVLCDLVKGTQPISIFVNNRKNRNISSALPDAHEEQQPSRSPSPATGMAVPRKSQRISSHRREMGVGPGGAAMTSKSRFRGEGGGGGGNESSRSEFEAESALSESEMTSSPHQIDSDVDMMDINVATATAAAAVGGGASCSGSSLYIPPQSFYSTSTPPVPFLSSTASSLFPSLLPPPPGMSLSSGALPPITTTTSNSISSMGGLLGSEGMALHPNSTSKKTSGRQRKAAVFPSSSVYPIGGTTTSGTPPRLAVAGGYPLSPSSMNVPSTLPLPSPLPLSSPPPPPLPLANSSSPVSSALVSPITSPTATNSAAVSHTSSSSISPSASLAAGGDGEVVRGGGGSSSMGVTMNNSMMNSDLSSSSSSGCGGTMMTTTTSVTTEGSEKSILDNLAPKIHLEDVFSNTATTATVTVAAASPVTLSPDKLSERSEKSETSPSHAATQTLISGAMDGGNLFEGRRTRLSRRDELSSRIPFERRERCNGFTQWMQCLPLSERLRLQLDVPHFSISQTSGLHASELLRWQPPKCGSDDNNNNLSIHPYDRNEFNRSPFPLSDLDWKVAMAVLRFLRERGVDTLFSSSTNRIWQLHDLHLSDDGLSSMSTTGDLSLIGKDGGYSPTVVMSGNKKNVHLNSTNTNNSGSSTSSLSSSSFSSSTPLWVPSSSSAAGDRNVRSNSRHSLTRKTSRLISSSTEEENVSGEELAAAAAAAIAASSGMNNNNSNNNSNISSGGISEIEATDVENHQLWMAEELKDFLEGRHLVEGPDVLERTCGTTAWGSTGCSSDSESCRRNSQELGLSELLQGENDGTADKISEGFQTIIGGSSSSSSSGGAVATEEGMRETDEQCIRGGEEGGVDQEIIINESGGDGGKVNTRIAVTGEGGGGGGVLGMLSRHSSSSGSSSSSSTASGRSSSSRSPQHRRRDMGSITTVSVEEPSPCGEGNSHSSNGSSGAINIINNSNGRSVAATTTSSISGSRTRGKGGGSGSFGAFPVTVEETTAAVGRVGGGGGEGGSAAWDDNYEDNDEDGLPRSSCSPGGVSLRKALVEFYRERREQQELERNLFAKLRERQERRGGVDIPGNWTSKAVIFSSLQNTEALEVEFSSSLPSTKSFEDEDENGGNRIATIKNEVRGKKEDEKEEGK